MGENIYAKQEEPAIPAKFYFSEKVSANPRQKHSGYYRKKYGMGNAPVGNNILGIT